MSIQSIENLRQRLRLLGAKPAHVRRILAAWLAARPLDAGARRQPAERERRPRGGSGQGLTRLVTGAWKDCAGCPRPDRTLMKRKS